MNNIPVEYYSSGERTYYIPPTPSTQSLLCYLDAGLTSSYTSGSSTWYDLSGNGYNATLSGSATMSFVTESIDGGSNWYGYSPAFRFENVGSANPKLWVVSSSLCAAFNPNNTTFPYGVCQTPPVYSSSGDWSVVLVGMNGYNIFTSYSGNALQIGDSGVAKFTFKVTGGDPAMYIAARYTVGTRQFSVGGVSQNYSTFYASKTCYGGSSKATYGGYYNTPYVTSYTNTDNDLGFAANQLLTGSGLTTVGTSWNGYISAVLIYNRILNPTEYSSISNYFVYRHLTP